MAEPAVSSASYAELEALPPNQVGEIIHGLLVKHPRPAPRNSVCANTLAYEISGPFGRGIGGPGGWIFMVEPELHLGNDVLVPDIAGWKRERLPKLPDTAWIETPPDWVCEILSPSTARLDRGAKREIYARENVAFLWLLDPVEHFLETFRLTASNWLLMRTFSDSEDVSARPFDAISFPLSNLWPYDAESAEGDSGEGKTGA